MAAEVLIIEDDPAYRNLIRQALSNMGLNCHASPGVRAGLDMALKVLPRLVVTDVHLPDGTGFEVCAWIKARPELSGTRVMMVTGSYRKEEDQLRAGKKGADAYLLKPFHLSELVRTVRSLI